MSATASVKESAIQLVAQLDFGGTGRLASSQGDVAGQTAWRSAADACAASIEDSSSRSVIASTDEVALIVRGHVVSEQAAMSSPQLVADSLLRRYLNTNHLEIEGLQGSFSIVVMDAMSGNVILFRNLVGCTNTYYALDGDRVLLGSNLAVLAGERGAAARANEQIWPSLFFHRYAAGKETLFEGIYRLRPGEQVRISRNGVDAKLRQTFADLRRPHNDQHDTVDQLQELFSRILAEHAAIDPLAVNFLSGGVDSSLIQATWNRVADVDHPISAAATVDHEVARRDRQYARTAASELKTDHREFQIDQDVEALLRDQITMTGELPNHLQSIYFLPLAKWLAGQGRTTALCGEGADGLFGNSSIAYVNRAKQIQRLVPTNGLRRLAARVAKAAGKGFLSDAATLSQFVDDVAHPDHPVNNAGTFADWRLVRAAFGDDVVERTYQQRRDVLREYQVGDNLLGRIHAIALILEGMETATLWSTCCNRAGVEVVCPFLDSRMLSFAVSCDQSQRFHTRRIKFLLREALARSVSGEIAYREKLGFGQPVFQWLARGGQLAALTDNLDRHAFLSEDLIAEAKKHPTWFLYTAACYNAWADTFLESR